MNAAFPFRPADDAAPAAWVIDRLRGFAESVVSIVPAGFAAYARVYHPPSRMIDGAWAPVRWADVARATNRTPHRQMQWPSILGTFQAQPNSIEASFQPPSEGHLPREIARSLWQTLAGHTTTSERCWFAVWEGSGALRADVRSAPSFEIPHRRLHLFTASIQASEASFDEPPFEQSANLWWPDDRAWCVATEIDFMTTYIGGSALAIAEIVARPELEANVVEPSDGVSWASDTINPQPSRNA